MGCTLAVVAALPLWGDPRGISFDDAARMAEAASLELRNAYANHALSEGAWALGMRAYLPKVSLNASEDDRFSEVSGDSFNKNYSIQVDQLVWDGGRTRMSRNLERAQLSLASAQLSRMGAGIAEGALAAYRQILSTRALTEIRRSALTSLSEQRQIMAREVELGRALPSDLAAADIAVAQTEIDLESLFLDLEESEREFAEALGLETLPPLLEQVDIYRSPVLPGGAEIRSGALDRHPSLAEARLELIQKQAEIHLSANSWMPMVRLTGTFSVSGRQYPLTHYNWSVGASIEFDSPLFSGSFSGQAGREPPHDRTGRMQGSTSLLPNPAGSLSVRSAALALSLAQANYRRMAEQVGRMAVLTLEKCRMVDRKRALAVEALPLAADRYRLEELRQSLGQLTRLQLMDARLEYAQREIEAVEAAAALLEAERELERLLDLRPGELALYVRLGGEAFWEQEEAAHEGN